jgi:metallophosphoesterase (TIGR00282 family)
MRVLFIGDIVGQPGRDLLARRIEGLVKAEKPDFIITNAENAAGGKGLTRPVAQELFGLGVDVLTLGNHTFDRKEIDEIIEHTNVVRPANYPPFVAGHGCGVYEARNNAGKIAVVNLMGRVYLPDLDCPFRKATELLEKLSSETKIIVVDFHAEVTSEKLAMGLFLDGRVSAVLGTHTHIPTADERVLDGGTAYISDVGMTGPGAGVIGMDRELVLKKFLTGIPQHFAVAKGFSVLQGVIIDIDGKSGRANSIRRFFLDNRASLATDRSYG